MANAVFEMPKNAIFIFARRSTTDEWMQRWPRAGRWSTGARLKLVALIEAQETQAESP